MLVFISLLLLFGCSNLQTPLSSEFIDSANKINNSAYLNYIDLNIQDESDFYVTQFILPDQAPYVMEIDIIAKTNSNMIQSMQWHTDREYYITECPDYWECPYVFDLMQDSTTQTNKAGRSVNTIRVSSEFASDTISVFSYFTDEYGYQYKDQIKILLNW